MKTRSCKNPQCGQKFDVYPSSERVYCTAKCRAANRKPRSDRGRRKTEWVTTTCPCGVHFECPPWQAKQNTYCSPKCVRKYARGSYRDGGRKPQVDLTTYDRDGYAYIYLAPPDRPTGMRGTRYAEHRFVMMQALGRDLLPGENVHHVNGVRTDNRPENLELWVTSQPKGQRVPDLVAWAHEIINRYEETEMAPTFYVDDYDGKRNDDAVEPITLSPVVEAKVVEPETKPAAKKTSRAKTKG